MIKTNLEEHSLWFHKRQAKKRARKVTDFYTIFNPFDESCLKKYEYSSSSIQEEDKMLDDVPLEKKYDEPNPPAQEIDKINNNNEINNNISIITFDDNHEDFFN